LEQGYDTLSIETIRRNERRKLSATLCNTIAAGLLAVGFFAPTVALMLQVENIRSSSFAFLGTILVVSAIAGFLHLSGRRILERLEE
jgi:hypothetical protein